MSTLLGLTGATWSVKVATMVGVVLPVVELGAGLTGVMTKGPAAS